jgi:nucleoid DNA-binding protein
MGQNTKADLAKYVGAVTDFDLEQCETAVDAVVAAMTSVFRQGEGIEIRGFGVFRVYKTAERLGRNPKTGAPAIVPSHYRVKFKVSPKMKVGVPVKKAKNAEKGLRNRQSSAFSQGGKESSEDERSGELLRG